MPGKEKCIHKSGDYAQHLRHKNYESAIMKPDFIFAQVMCSRFSSILSYLHCLTARYTISQINKEKDILIKENEKILVS